MRPKPASCQGCPAFTVGKSFVPGRGSRQAKVVFVGQGPGEQEAWGGQPFVGRAGQQLDVWIAKANRVLQEEGSEGVVRSDCFITNIVQCWLPNNREPTREEVAYCWVRHGAEELWLLKDTLKVIVPVGVPSMKVFIPGKVGERSAGSVYKRKLKEVCKRPGGGGPTQGQ